MELQNKQPSTQTIVKSESRGSDLDSSGPESDCCGEYSCWQILLMLFNAINHALVLLVTGYLVYLARDLSSVTNLHVVLCTIGYVLLMSEAIVALTGENLWSRRLTRRSNSHVHWILQALGAGFSVAGVVVMYRVKSKHFLSVHALTGIASVGAICALFVSGLPALYAARLRKLLRPVIGKFVHNFLGILCFVVGMVSQCYGYQKTFFVRLVSQEMANVLVVTTAMITFFSLIGSLRSLLEQFKGLAKCR